MRFSSFCLAVILLVSGLNSCTPNSLNINPPDHAAVLQAVPAAQASAVAPTDFFTQTRPTSSTPGAPPSADGAPGGNLETTLPETRAKTPSPAPNQDAAALPDDIAQNAGMDAYLGGLTSLGEFSGAALVSQGKHLLLHKGYGFSDRSGQAAISPDTRFDIASLTKAFTAAAALRLQAEGKLDVQDSICNYLDTCPPAWQPITLQQLLTHTSGIPDYANSDRFGQIDQEDCTPAQIIPLFHDKPLDFLPGSQWRYSNSGYVLLGAVVEKVSGEPYETYLAENLFEPLGLRDTGMDRDEVSVAVGYADSETQAGHMNLSSLYSAGGYYSTVDDLYRWYRGLAGGKVIPGELFDQMMTPIVQTQDGTGRSYGYGWFLDGSAPPAWVAHGGRVAGFSAEIIHRQEDDALVIVLSNQANVDAEGIGFKLLSMLPGD